LKNKNLFGQEWKMTKFSILIFLFSMVLSASAFSIDECGENAQDARTLHWEKLGDVVLNAKVMNSKGLLCAGSHPGKPELIQVNYRDDQGTKKSFLVKDLMEKRQVLVSHEDLNIGIIKEGPIMSIKIDKTQKAAGSLNYIVSLRFLRNLSKMSSGRDHRQVEFKVDGNSIGVDTSAPYSANWPSCSSSGSHQITATATDGVGLTGNNSVTITATCGDLLPPSVPGNLTATRVNDDVALAWDASVDPSGGSGMKEYRVYRGVTQVGTVTHPTTSYTDTSAPA